MKGAVFVALLVAAAVCAAAAVDEFHGGEGRPAAVEVDPSWQFPSRRLRDAYVALQTWKVQAIFSDPYNFTADWVGPDVCNYTGVYCGPLPSDPRAVAVAGVDLNHGDIAGFLPPELGLLADLALLHLNSNRFCGVLPPTLRRLRLLHELDLSNNRFVGAFPDLVLDLPALRFLDLRFNDFEGAVPAALFDRPLDAIFLNHNRLRFQLPDNLGNSPASVLPPCAPVHPLPPPPPYYPGPLPPTDPVQYASPPPPPYHHLYPWPTVHPVQYGSPPPPPRD
ncbi:hypothetical protein EJB05_31145, partial [Eragrostis curvula]